MGKQCLFVIQKHSKHKKCAISSPLWATGNDVQKLHGLVFAHYCGAVLVQEVLCSIVKLIQVEAERNMQFGDKVIDEVAAYIAQNSPGINPSLFGIPVRCQTQRIFTYLQAFKYFCRFMESIIFSFLRSLNTFRT